MFEHDTLRESFRQAIANGSLARATRPRNAEDWKATELPSMSALRADMLVATNVPALSPRSATFAHVQHAVERTTRAGYAVDPLRCPP